MPHYEKKLETNNIQSRARAGSESQNAEIWKYVSLSSGAECWYDM